MNLPSSVRTLNGTSRPWCVNVNCSISSLGAQGLDLIWQPSTTGTPKCHLLAFYACQRRFRDMTKGLFMGINKSMVPYSGSDGAADNYI